MKAIQIDEFIKDFSQLQPKHVPDPDIAPGRNKLKIKITHAALSHVDMLYAQGLHQNNQRHVKPPFILGNEFAGIVVAAPASSRFPPGTRVFGGTLGAYAEYAVVDEGAVRSVPAQWSNAEACAVGASGAISWGSFEAVGGVRAGEWVVVLGATGGLGVQAIQIAKAHGGNVIAVVSGHEKAQMVTSLGADVVVDYTSPDWEAQVRAATPGQQGAHVVYDAIGAVESGIKCLRFRGRLVIVGFAARSGKMEAVRANRILLKGVTVVGYRFGEDGRHDPQKPIAAWKAFMQLVTDGKIKPVIYKEVYAGLEALPRAMTDLKERRAWGRAVLRISDEDDEKARL